MKVTFKGSAESITCTEPVEQKMFRSGNGVGWALMFHLHGPLSSSEIDALVTPDSISELTFTSDDEKTTFKLNGYSGVTACMVRHREGATVAELQLTKNSEADSKEGADGNGKI